MMSGSVTASIAVHGGASRSSDRHLQGLTSSHTASAPAMPMPSATHCAATVKRIRSAHSVGSHIAITQPITAPIHARTTTGLRLSSRAAISSPAAINAASQIMPTI